MTMIRTSNFGYLDRAGREEAEVRLKELWLAGKINTADHCLLHQALMCLDDLMCERERGDGETTEKKS